MLAGIIHGAVAVVGASAPALTDAVCSADFNTHALAAGILTIATQAILLDDRVAAHHVVHVAELTVEHKLLTARGDDAALGIGQSRGTPGHIAGTHADFTTQVLDGTTLGILHAVGLAGEILQATKHAHAESVRHLLIPVQTSIELQALLFPVRRLPFGIRLAISGHPVEAQARLGAEFLKAMFTVQGQVGTFLLRLAHAGNLGIAINVAEGHTHTAAVAHLHVSPHGGALQVNITCANIGGATEHGSPGRAAAIGDAAGVGTLAAHRIHKAAAGGSNAPVGHGERLGNAVVEHGGEVDDAVLNSEGATAVCKGGGAGGDAVGSGVTVAQFGACGVAIALEHEGGALAQGQGAVHLQLAAVIQDNTAAGVDGQSGVNSTRGVGCHLQGVNLETYTSGGLDFANILQSHLVSTGNGIRTADIQFASRALIRPYSQIASEVGRIVELAASHVDVVADMLTVEVKLAVFVQQHLALA